MKIRNNTTTIVKGTIITLLLLCLINADYGFYQAMRILVSFGFAFLSYQCYKTGDKAHAIIFLCFLIVFQPLIRIGLGRDIWIVVDVIVAGYLVYQVFTSLKVDNASKQSKSNSKWTQDSHESSINYKANIIRKKW